MTRRGKAPQLSPGRWPVLRDGVRLDLLDRLTLDIFERAEQLGMRSAPSLSEGGWRSGSLREWSSPAIGELLVTLKEAAQSSDIEAWAMINRRGSRHPRHVHRGAILSGVYYVHAGEAGAPTIFEPPGAPELHVEPVPGRLVMFPADLYHRVDAYHGDDPRITVAFDVKNLR